jgi:archaeosine synthase
VIEVVGRAGPARLVKWHVGDHKVVLPNIISSSEFGANFENQDIVLVPATDNDRVVHKPSGIGLFEIPAGLYPPLHHSRGDEGQGPTLGTGCMVVRGDPRRFSQQWSTAPSSVAILGNAFELRRDARQLARSIVNLREVVGNRVSIYAPGIMDTSNLALLSYMGVDLFDDSLLAYLAHLGQVSTADGILDAKKARWVVREDALEAITTASMRSAWNELELVRHHIREESLRELVEMRVHSSPWMVAALRIFDEEHYDFQEKRFPVVGPSFHANSKAALFRPDVWRFRRRVIERYRRPSHKKILLLLPCSAKKPYHISKSHQAFRNTIQSVSNFDMVHEVIVTSPLGIVPREIELFYPAAQYDIPVTGHWDREEVAMVQTMVKGLVSQGYDRVICHLGDEADIVKEVVQCEDTTRGGPTSFESLDNLRGLLAELCSNYERLQRGEDRVNTIASVARFQFGDGAEVLAEGATVTGTYPYSRISLGKVQLGMLTPERGMISLTMDGAEHLLGHGLGTVEIKDFQLQTNLFAVGVQAADHGIRIGDEVAIIRNGTLQGVGVAMMPGIEMADSDRGEAVRVRHYRKN